MTNVNKNIIIKANNINEMMKAEKEKSKTATEDSSKPKQ